MRTWFAAAILGLMASGAWAQDVRVGDLTVHEPWLRAVPAGAPVAGGYVRITNNGTVEERLTGVESDIAGHIMLHAMAVTDGIMTMRGLDDGLSIAPGATVELKPGGMHIMFMDLQRRPKPGESFTGTLLFAHAGPVEVTFAVAPIGAKGPMPASQHTHPAQ
jgi:periplasmic copper chaperone A